jgi:hypothetical protein
MRRRGAWSVVALLVAGCGAPVEEGLFFPTWDASGDTPTGIVEGTLVEDDRCLFVEAHGRRTLVAWEDGMGFEDGALLAASSSPIAHVGETIHGGGGYFGDRDHIEHLSGEPIPQRCIPDTADGDRFAITYEVEAGPFE